MMMTIRKLGLAVTVTIVDAGSISGVLVSTESQALGRNFSVAFAKCTAIFEHT